MKRRKLIKVNDRQNKLQIKVVSEYKMISKYTIIVKNVTDFVNNHFSSEYSVVLSGDLLKVLLIEVLKE